MNKKTVVIFSIVVIIFSIFMLDRNNQYILAWQANKKIDISGIKLMMTETEVRRLIGEEEVYIPGFGGYRLEYPSKSIFLSFLDDGDTDFYRRVNEITITDSKYKIYGIKVGDELDKALNVIYNQGFISVFASLKSSKADGIACPNIAGYNDHIIVKEKGCLCCA